MKPSSPSQASGRVISNLRLTPDIYSIRLRLPREWGPALPGQFVMVECPPIELFGLRRPFSLAACRASELGVELEIVYGVVGLRTQGLSEVRAGETLEILGPLGRPFTPFPGRIPLLVGGGRGIAPLLMLAERWAADYPDGSLIYGARGQSALIPLKESPYPVHLATEDGSVGFSGSALDLLRHLLHRGSIRREEVATYGCGPNRMLAGLARWSREQAVPCQVSLETHFGCGIGICAGCAVPIRRRDGSEEDAFHRYAFACSDGPVMDATKVEWDALPE